MGCCFSGTEAQARGQEKEDSEMEGERANELWKREAQTWMAGPATQREGRERDVQRQGDLEEGWMWAMLAGWVVGVGPGKNDQAWFSGPGQLGGWRGWVHIKGVEPLAAGTAPPFPCSWALLFDLCMEEGH